MAGGSFQGFEARRFRSRPEFFRGFPEVRLFLWLPVAGARTIFAVLTFKRDPLHAIANPENAHLCLRAW
jgi:hypothetical protein